MADVTGRIYEALTEFILCKLGYRDEWSSGTTNQYLYEKHIEALCHRSTDICPYAKECTDFSRRENIPYGPWYDPDFLIVEGNQPIACIHVTHWSEAATSPRKFWRTAEEMFQYKTLFGASTLSINLVFESLSAGEQPSLVLDSDQLILMHGWKLAVGTIHALAHDASVLFPRNYYPLQVFVASLAPKIPKSTRRRREYYNRLWEDLYTNDKELRGAVDKVVVLLKKSLRVSVENLYSKESIVHLQNVCWEGRQRSINLHPTQSSYRKGIQLSFILREVLSRCEKGVTDADDSLWNVLQSNPRFHVDRFSRVLKLSPEIPQQDLSELFQLLTSMPIRIDKRVSQSLLREDAGIEHVAWDPSFAQFILGLRELSSQDIEAFKDSLLKIFEKYRLAYGMDDVLADISDSVRIYTKAKYVFDNFIGITNEQEFIEKVASDMHIPGGTEPHQYVVSDVHNWVAEMLLTFYGIGPSEHITIPLALQFEQKYGEPLSNYCFNGDIDRLPNHLLSAVDVSQHFSKRAKLSLEAFYEAIWPIFAQCIWQSKVDLNLRSLDDVLVIYRYRKIMRIIASPDLEPISFLFRRHLPTLIDGPILRGVYNQLSSHKGWSRAALITESSGMDSQTGAVIQTQSVFGKKNIDHKVKELAARLRSLHLKYNDDGEVEPEYNPGIHYLVVDGDWPVYSKINLYEAGFSGIYEIGELGQLSDELNLNNSTA